MAPFSINKACHPTWWIAQPHKCVLVRTFSHQFLSREASDVNTACSSSMAGGKVHVSFVASSHTHSVQPNKLNCTINFNTYKQATSNFPFMSFIFWKLKWQDFVISSQLRLMYCVFSLRGNKSHSTCKRSRDSSDCFGVIFSLYFLNVLQSDNNSNTVYVLGYKYVLGPSQLILALA